VHWLDPYIAEYDRSKPNTGEALLYWFDRYVLIYGYLQKEKLTAKRAKQSAKLNPRIEQDMDDCVCAINSIVRSIDVEGTPPFTNDTDTQDKDQRHVLLTERYVVSTKEERLQFLDRCIQKLKNAKHFHRCFSQNRMQDNQIYRDVFWDYIYYQWIDPKSPTVEPQENLEGDYYYFYFRVHRFFMDVYTCCRILKKEDPWYKNVVLYAGYAHIRNCSGILQRIGYEHHPVTEIEYNASCIE
jgi:hypothetical protein